MQFFKSFLFTFIFSLVISNLSAQEKLLEIFPAVDNKITYSEIVDVKETSQSELHQRAKIWFAKTFNSSKNVIQLDEDSLLIGKGFYEIIIDESALGGQIMRVWVTISIEFKENRYRYIITDLIGETIGTYGTKSPIEIYNNKWRSKKKREKRNAEINPKVHAGMLNLIESLKKGMYSKKDNDW